MHTSFYTFCLSLLITIGLSGIHELSADPVDTIFANCNTKSYLAFDEEVELVDVGNKDFYKVAIQGRNVFLLGVKDSVETIPIYVVFKNQSVFAATLRWDPLATKQFYDFRKNLVETRSYYNHRNYIPPTPTKVMVERLQGLEHEKRTYKSVAARVDDVTFALENVKNDHSAYYLKFKVENKTSIIYQLDYVGFDNVEFYRKKFFSKKRETRIPVTPLIDSDIRDVKPYCEEYFYFALPIYAVGSRGGLIVTLREISGVRTVEVEIPYKVLATADLY